MSRMFAFLFLIALSVSNTQAQDEKFLVKVLTKNTIKNIIGDFPAKGSSEEAADYAEILKWQNERTTEECNLANSQHSAKITSMFAYEGGPLTLKEAKSLQRRFLKEYGEISLNVYRAKKMFNRLRPYDANPEVKPCIDLEGSSAYPSGHTTMARAMALLIATVYPERKEALLKTADQAALNRIIGGVHHPSDVVAGKKLGDALFKLIYVK